MKKVLLEKLRFHEAFCKITGVKHNQDVLMLLCSPKLSPAEEGSFPCETVHWPSGLAQSGDPCAVGL